MRTAGNSTDTRIFPKHTTSDFTQNDKLYIVLAIHKSGESILNMNSLHKWMSGMTMIKQLKFTHSGEFEHVAENRCQFVWSTTAVQLTRRIMKVTCTVTSDPSLKSRLLHKPRGKSAG